MYDYESIPQTPASFRLLKLAPGNGPDRLRGELENVSFASEPNYTALSYCWGDPSPFDSLDCGSGSIDIGQSLTVALRRLRDAEKAKYIWADAVCINQKDGEEKSAQVAMMRDIYVGAASVAVWLGERANKSELAVRWVNENAATFRARGRPAGATTPTGESDPYQHIKVFASPAVRALLELVQRAWFSRVWIIQEVAVAVAQVWMYVGPDEMRWSDFSDVCSWASESGIAVFAPARLEKPLLIAAARSEYEKRDVGHSDLGLLQLAMRHRQFSATDSRDKIFALSGLAPDFNSAKWTQMRIDYTQATEEVFHDLAKQYLAFDSLEILSVPRVDRKHDNLPSWVPHWDIVDSARPVFDMDREKWHQWHAGGNAPAYIDTSSRSPALGLRGMLVDSIVDIGNEWVRQDTSSLSRTPRSVAEIYNAVRKQIQTTIRWEKLAKADSDAVYQPTGEATRDVFWQTMIAGCVDQEQYDVRKDEFEKAQALYRRHRKINKFFLDRTLPTFAVSVVVVHLMYVCAVRLGLGDASTLVPRDFNLQFAISAASTGRKLCRTKGGYLALVPKLAEIGDKIMLVSGGRAPLVLRRRQGSLQSGDEFELIGDAYVHGMMRGECFEDADRCCDFWLI